MTSQYSNRSMAALGWGGGSDGGGGGGVGRSPEQQRGLKCHLKYPQQNSRCTNHGTCEWQGLAVRSTILSTLHMIQR